MSRTAGTRAVIAAVSLFALASCGLAVPRPPSAQSLPPPSTASTSPADRSQAALDDLVGDKSSPGCTAAVGERGTVIWQGVSGLADLERGRALTPDSPVDIASVAKQFTATALLLLEHEGRLALDDRLSDHLGSLPSWADDVTLGQLMRHTSGIPEYMLLLQERSVSAEMKSTRKDVLAVLGEVGRLNFVPGSSWEYSNSNYALLAVVIEAVTDVPLQSYLQGVLFQPLDLSVRSAVGDGALPSYRRSAGGHEFELVDWQLYPTGLAGLRTTPSTLVRWADTYRTGAPAGSWLNDQRFADAAPGGPDGIRYGAGVFVHPDGWMGHNGTWAGFNTAFMVSGDRLRSLALTCLRVELDPWTIAQELSEDWFVGAR